ncbi:MAG: sugar phosphate isomerase/epimerase [Clostridiales bacterium]|nr:sugar phosphate isomerase/epimerase [Clostridiales bacterium]
MKIGVIPDSFHEPFNDAVAHAVEIGVQGLQPYCTGGRLCPEILLPSLRKELLAFVKGNGLEFSALCADFGMKFNTREFNTLGIERTKRMMDLALDLDTHIITTHIGKVPEDENCEEYENMVRSIEALGKYGDEIGCVFATETGPEKALALRGVLEKADTHSAKVNLDPANFVMTVGQDPVEAVYILKDYIAHTHAKDGRHHDVGGGETPLGQGDVPWKEYLAALKDVGYDGFLTIERECGADRVGDIRIAAEFLKERLKELGE